MIRPLTPAFAKMDNFRRLLLSLAALVLLSTAWPAAAQQVIDNSFRTGNKLPYANLPQQYRDALLSQDLAKEAPESEIEDVIGIPWNAPNGDRLVGVVEDRMLTQSQLTMRVNMMLKGTEPITDPIKSQDRRVLLESRILSDWKEFNTLAVHAERSGYTVTQSEIDKTMSDLATQSDGAPQKSQEIMQMIGIPEDQLKAEVRDGILVEKLIRDKIPEFFPERTMQDLFAKDRSVFLEPTKVQAWQLFYPQMGRMTDTQKRDLEKNLKRYGKQLRKCEDPADYKKLADDIKQVDSLMLSNMDWVYEDENIPAEVRRELFTMKPGKTSDVIRSRLGFHVVKVIDRKEGDQGTFEEARPAIENFLFEKTKILVYETAKKNYKIFTNSGGLNIWKKVTREEARRIGSSRSAASATTGTAITTPGGDLGDVPPMLPAAGDSLDVPSVESLIGKQ